MKNGFLPPVSNQGQDLRYTKLSLRFSRILERSLRHNGNVNHSNLKNFPTVFSISQHNLRLKNFFEEKNPFYVVVYFNFSENTGI